MKKNLVIYCRLSAIALSILCSLSLTNFKKKDNDCSPSESKGEMKMARVESIVDSAKLSYVKLTPDELKQIEIEVSSLDLPETKSSVNARMEGTDVPVVDLYQFKMTNWSDYKNYYSNKTFVVEYKSIDYNSNNYTYNSLGKLSSNVVLLPAGSVVTDSEIKVPGNKGLDKQVLSFLLGSAKAYNWSDDQKYKIS